MSFSDGTQCGDGTIYRASGFVLTQIKKNTSLYETPSGIPMSEVTWNSATPERRVLIAKQYGMTKFDASSFITKTAKLNGMKSLVGYQLRYVYFLNPEAKKRLTVPILPFSRIDEMGAGMYKGIPKRGTGANSGDQSESGGSTPTTTLQSFEVQQ